MARKKLEYSDIYPFHIYGRSNNAEWFQVSEKQCWDIFCTFLNYVVHCYNLRVHAFVLMSNHYHLLASAPDNNLPLIMNRFCTEISTAINEVSGRKNHVFGGQYKASIIKNGNYFQTVLRYVYRNPIAVGLVRRAEDYPYSTLNGLMGKGRLLIPISENQLFQDYIDDDYFELMNWINNPFSPEQAKMVATALKRREFFFNKRLERQHF